MPPAINVANDPMAAIRVMIREEYESAKNYSNVILGVGYAGFFGLWVIAKDFGYPKTHAAAALCIAISLILFVFWEVYQTGVKGNSLRRLSKSMAGGALDAITYKRESEALMQQITRAWVLIYYPCVVFGLLGAGTLLAVLMLRAFKDLTG